MTNLFNDPQDIQLWGSRECALVKEKETVQVGEAPFIQTAKTP